MNSMRPTRVRFAVVGCATLMSLLLYLDRFCVSFAEIFMKQDLRLSDVEIGWMLSAFFWTYALAQVPSGWLTDRFGARVMLTIYVLGWSLFTGLNGFATGIGTLLVARLGCGLLQAGAYPTSASLLSRWVPLAARGTASSIVALGGRVGGALAPLLTAALIVAYVPISQPSLLSTSDILDWREFCRELAVPNVNLEDDSRQAQAARWIWERITPEHRAILASLGEREPLIPTQYRGQWRHGLLYELNRVLLDAEFVKQPFVKVAELPLEGKQLAERDMLDEEQQARLNRLALESLFGKTVKRVYVRGWRPVMKTYGWIGIPVALLFWSVFRNRPSEHEWCNQAEKDLIEYGRAAPSATARPLGAAPLLALVSNLSMWLNCVSQCATNVGWVFLVTWLPRYLDHEHHIPLEQRAIMTFIPTAVGFLGMFLGGQLTDRLVGVIGLRWGRALPMGMAKFLAMGAYLVCLFEPSPWMAVAMFSLVAFATDLGIGSVWAYAQDVGGRHVGSVLGWGNMWGNLGAAVTPPFLIWVVGDPQRWNAAFLTCAVAFLIAGIAALGIDASKPLVRESS